VTFRGPGARLDASVLEWSLSHRPWWALRCDEWVLWLGSPLLMPLALLLTSVIVAWRRGSPEPVRNSLTLIAVLTAGVLITKDLFVRPGPGALASTTRPSHVAVHGPDSPWAFPSGHVATALVTWTAGARLLLEGRPNVRARLVVTTVAAMVSLALVTGGFHWLTDVLAAWPFAFLIARTSSAIAAVHPLRTGKRGGVRSWVWHAGRGRPGLPTPPAQPAGDAIDNNYR
jgi:membrane-associated phospholipid phosphatase